MAMDDRAVMRSFETGRGRRVAALVVALVVVAVVVGFVIKGFGSKPDAQGGAKVLSDPIKIQTKPTEKPGTP